jgi:hypothetical protein
LPQPSVASTFRIEHRLSAFVAAESCLWRQFPTVVSLNGGGSQEEKYTAAAAAAATNEGA